MTGLFNFVTLAGDLDERREVEHGGIVNQDVEAAGLCHHLGDGCINRSLVGDVEPNCIGALADFSGRCRGSGGVDIPNRDGGALFHVGFGKGGTNPAGSAGNKGRFSFESHRHYPTGPLIFLTLSIYIPRDDRDTALAASSTARALAFVGGGTGQPSIAATAWNS